MNFGAEMLDSILNSTVLVAIVIGSFRLFQKAYENHSKRRRAKAHKKGMEDSIEVWEELQILRVRTHLSRIVVAVVHNGGDILSPSSAKFVTALEDTFSNDMEGSIKKDFQRIPIDNQYKEVLKRTLDSKYYHLTSSMLGPDSGDDRIRDKNGLLYNVYEANKVKSVFLIYLGATENGLVLMSLQSLGVKDDLTPKDISVIRASLPVLRKKLQIYERPKNTL